MKTCRLTFNPDKLVDLDDAEYLDLKRQGIVVPGSEASEPSVESAPTDSAGVAETDNSKNK
jgi:hypothetical protein